MGSTAGAAASLARRVRDAATQRLHLRARETDREFRQNGGTLVHSIDTNIVVLYLDPARAPASAEAGGGSHHYARVFADDPEDLGVALGKRITDFIFYRLNDQAPVVMAAPLQRELARVFEGIAAAAGREQLEAEGELARLQDSVGALRVAFETAATPGERLDLLLERLPTLRGFLFGFGGPSVMLSRLEDLLRQTRLIGLNRASGPGAVLNQATLQAISRPNSMREFIDYQRSRERWRQRLTRTKSSKTPERNIDADCEVLAWLEMVNGDEQGGVRVVHVTGDRAMFQAARSCKKEEDQESFAERYLRDPRAFLAEPGVFFGDEGDGGQSPAEFVEWLDVFLGKFAEEAQLVELAGGQDVDPDVVAMVLEEDADEVERFDRRWRAFCRPMVLDLAGDLADVSPASGSPWDQYRAALDRFGIRVDTDHADIHTLEGMIESLGEVIDRRIDETWRKCFNTSTRIGFDLMHAGREPTRSRYAAPISFPGYPEVSTFFTDMLRGAEGVDRTGVGQALDDVPEYVFYLVFGGLFGAEGGWPMARVLADRAIAAIPHASEQSDAPGEKISGREAYYLRAIAGRLTARSESALDEAEEYLALAYEALAQEHRDNPGHTVTTVRFDAETIAFRISRSLFRRFRMHARDWRQPLVDWRVDISARLERVDAELKDVTLRERVRVALETNYLLCLILTSAEHPSEAPSTREDLHLRDRGMLEDLSRRVNNADALGMGATYLVQAVLLAARTALEPPAKRAERRALRARIVEHFNETAIEENRVTVYDAERFAFLREFALAYLTAPRR